MQAAPARSRKSFHSLHRCAEYFVFNSFDHYHYLELITKNGIYSSDWKTKNLSQYWIYSQVNNFWWVNLKPSFHVQSKISRFSVCPVCVMIAVFHPASVQHHTPALRSPLSPLSLKEAGSSPVYSFLSGRRLI